MIRKINWTENALQELERLLGARPDVEIEDLDDSIGGLDFPWPITVKNLTAETDAEGAVWCQVIIEFDEIAGAGGYEVKFSLVPDTGQFEIVDPQTVSIGSTGGPQGNDIIEGAISSHRQFITPTIGPNDIGVLVGPGNAHRSVDPPDLTDGPAPGGGFATWEAIYNPNNGDKIGAWLGRGVGSGNVNYGNHGPLVDRGMGVLFILRNWGGATVKEYSVSTVTDGGTSKTTPTLTAGSNEFIITAIDTIRDAIPDGTYTASGYASGLYVNDWYGGIYANGCAAAGGLSLGAGPVNGTFGIINGDGSRNMDLMTIRIGF